MPAPTLSALATFSFPTTLVVTGGSAVGGGILLEAEDVDEVSPFASVTKPIIAWTALIAVDRGLLDLEVPVDSPVPDGTAIEDLLSHSPGIVAGSNECLTAPDTYRVHPNRGIEILGERFEEVTGTSPETWMEATILESLGMTSVPIPGSPAHSGEGNIRDLSLFVRELTVPRFVSSTLTQRAYTPILPGLDSVLPGYRRRTPDPLRLGVEVRGAKSLHWTGVGNSEQVFGHSGQSGSSTWVDPVTERQAVFLRVQPFGVVHQRT